MEAEFDYCHHRRQRFVVSKLRIFFRTLRVKPEAAERDEIRKKLTHALMGRAWSSHPLKSYLCKKRGHNPILAKYYYHVDHCIMPPQLAEYNFYISRFSATILLSKNIQLKS